MTRMGLALAAALTLVLAPTAALAQSKAKPKPAPARAADVAACSVLEIEASNGKGGVDPALRALSKKLKKPPFSSWSTFKLLKKHDTTLEKMKQTSFQLVPGGKLGLLYRDKSEADGKKIRLRLGFTLDDKDGKRKVDGTIKLDSGDYYLIGGNPLKDGATYIVAVSCKAAS